jgi:putative ABC transport system ATP-binding protein
MRFSLETRNLTKIYRVGKVDVPALRGVNLQVKKGEFVAIMGPSGCGKSTLLHLLGGLLSPTSGDIFIDGTNIANSGDRQRTEVRRKKIGFVFQRFNLFPTISAKDNIELARRIHGNQGVDSGTVDEILEILGLKEKMDHKPLELSGGEQQRVALARAVINRPSIILADEPTGNLDSVNSHIVMRMLRDLNLKYNQTILVITHEATTATYAHRVIEMLDGKVVPKHADYHVEHEGVFTI